MMTTLEVEELGHGHKGEGGRADHVGGVGVEGVDLVAQPLREARVLDLLQAGAVDVPGTALRDVS